MGKETRKRLSGEKERRNGREKSAGEEGGGRDMPKPRPREKRSREERGTLKGNGKEVEAGQGSAGWRNGAMESIRRYARD